MFALEVISHFMQNRAEAYINTHQFYGWFGAKTHAKQ